MENMDRITYAHSVGTGVLDFNTAFVNYFDQLMGLYGFIQPHNYHTEIVSSENNNLILNLEFSDGDSAMKIANILSASDGTMPIYGRVFRFSVKPVALNILQLFITE